MNSDDLILRSICPKLLHFEDRYFKFKDINNRFINVTSVKSSNVVDALNKHIYDCSISVIKNPNISIKSIERTYHSLCNKWLTDGVLTVDLIAKGWVRFLDLFKIIQDKLQEYHESYPVVDISKAIRGSHYSMSIDCLLRKLDSHKVDLLMITPKQSANRTMQGLSNIETILALDYLFEAGLDVGKVVELSYSHSFSDKTIRVREVNVNENVANVVERHLQKLEHKNYEKTPNILYCNMCPYSDRCTMSSRL